MKTDEDIKIQIDRFMAGETSIEDEARLAEYFRTNIVKEELVGKHITKPWLLFLYQLCILL